MENENIKLNLPPFYVGQRVVYVSGLNMPKDSIHVVRGLFRHPCGCWGIDIGKKKPELTVYFCATHPSADRIFKDGTLINIFCSTSFRPLEERFISLAEVIKIESPLTCVN